MKYRFFAILFLSILCRAIMAQANLTLSLQQRIQNKESANLFRPTPDLNRTSNINSLPEQDCNSAIIVCQPVFSLSSSYSGVGNTSEIPSNSCLGANEKNSVWYTLTTNSSGSIEFLITPNNLGDDYDFALYDVTTQGCGGINSGVLLPVRCNFSAASGTTGLSAAGSNASEPASGSNYSTVLSTQAAKTYVLVISNYSSSVFGYTLDFSASTAAIYTGTVAALQQVNSYCGTDSLLLNLSRPVVNASIALDGSDFSLSGPGGPYTITSAQGTGNLYSNQVNIKFSPSLSGLGTWTLGVLVGSDSNTLLEGCSSMSTAVSSMTFNTQPLTFVAGPTSVCKGSSFTLTASPATTYTWSGSMVPAAQINQPSISINTNTAGVFSFSVQTNGVCGMTTSTKTVSILDFPTANFSVVSASPICAGSSISFSNTTIFPCSTGGNGTNICNCGTFLCNPTSNQNIFANYAWDYGDTTAQVIGYNPVHTYTNSGSYVIHLRAGHLTVNSGCISTKTLAVTVSSSPVLSVASGTICSGNSFIFSATGANTYTWNTGVSTQSMVVTPTVSTSYTVIGSNSCGSSSQTVSVAVNPSPTISVTNGSICIGDTYTITPIGADTYTYSGGSNVVNPLTTTVYSVTGLNANNCSNTQTVSVIVNVLPIIVVNNGTVCNGASFTITPSGANTYTYSAGSEIVNPVVNSDYTITGTDINGCVGSATMQVSISPNPTINIVTAGTVCVGSSITMSANGADSYVWNTGELTQTIIITPTITNTYSVTGTDLNNCSTTQTVSVIVDNTCQDVWPGDANSDGVADNLDVLELGLHYAQTGTPRVTTSNTWQSYFANNWTGTITSGKNLNHSDCNGDGTINDDDTLAIYNNYGLTHVFKVSQTNTVNPQLSIVPDQPGVVTGNWGTSSIYLGDAAININNVNGVAFTVDFDNTLIEPNSIYVEYQPSFMDASQNLHFKKLDFANGKIYTATTHTISNNVSGNGKIATLHYQIKSGLTSDQVLNIGLSVGNQSDILGIITPLTTGTGTLMAIASSVGLLENLNYNSISISPNPTNGSLSIHSKMELQKIEIVSITGQVLLAETPTVISHVLHLDNFANGIYFVNVYQNDRIIKREKIVLNK